MRGRSKADALDLFLWVGSWVTRTWRVFCAGDLIYARLEEVMRIWRALCAVNPSYARPKEIMRIWGVLCAGNSSYARPGEVMCIEEFYAPEIRVMRI